jgi:hypothetical protein
MRSSGGYLVSADCLFLSSLLLVQLDPHAGGRVDPLCPSTPSPWRRPAWRASVARAVCLSRVLRRSPLPGHEDHRVDKPASARFDGGRRRSSAGGGPRHPSPGDHRGDCFRPAAANPARWNQMRRCCRGAPVDTGAVAHRQARGCCSGVNRRARSPGPVRTE